MDLSPNGAYTPKAGYATICVGHYNRATKWWWKRLWKMQCPTKNKLFFWSILELKVPTWDILQKRCFEGPGRCCLCKIDNESILHLFLKCPFGIQIWKEVYTLLNIRGDWRGASIEDALSLWWGAGGYRQHKVAPLIISWGIWISRNAFSFNGSLVSPTETAYKATSILAFFFDSDSPINRRIISP